MNKLVICALVGLMLVSCVLAADEASAGKHDFVQLIENTDHCFDCYTVYKITKADDVSLSRLGVDFKDAKGDFVIPDYELTYLWYVKFFFCFHLFFVWKGFYTPKFARWFYVFG